MITILAGHIQIERTDIRGLTIINFIIFFIISIIVVIVIAVIAIIMVIIILVIVAMFDADIVAMVDISFHLARSNHDIFRQQALLSQHNQLMQARSLRSRWRHALADLCPRQMLPSQCNQLLDVVLRPSRTKR